MKSSSWADCEWPLFPAGPAVFQAADGAGVRLRGGARCRRVGAARGLRARGGVRAVGEGPAGQREARAAAGNPRRGRVG